MDGPTSPAASRDGTGTRLTTPTLGVDEAELRRLREKCRDQLAGHGAARETARALAAANGSPHCPTTGASRAAARASGGGGGGAWRRRTLVARGEGATRCCTPHTCTSAPSAETRACTTSAARARRLHSQRPASPRDAMDVVRELRPRRGRVAEPREKRAAAVGPGPRRAAGGRAGEAGEGTVLGRGNAGFRAREEDRRGRGGGVAPRDGRADAPVCAACEDARRDRPPTRAASLTRPHPCSPLRPQLDVGVQLQQPVEQLLAPARDRRDHPRQLDRRGLPQTATRARIGFTDAGNRTRERRARILTGNDARGRDDLYARLRATCAASPKASKFTRRGAKRKRCSTLERTRSFTAEVACSRRDAGYGSAVVA